MQSYVVLYGSLMQNFTPACPYCRIHHYIRKNACSLHSTQMTCLKLQQSTHGDCTAGSTPQTSIANSTIPMGLQWVIEDSTGFPCHTPLGPAYSTNNKLVQSMTPFQDFPNDRDCQSALQGATAIGLQALWANISFCIDDVQLLSNTTVSEGATPSAAHLAECRSCL